MLLPSCHTTVEQLEQKELEGKLDSADYQLLLALYLQLNQLRDAHLLWKRIPEEMKPAGGEMSRIWQVGQCLCAKNFAQLYQVGADTCWGEAVHLVMLELMESVRRRTFSLVIKSYTSIGEDQFSTLVHLPVATAIADALAVGWERDETAKMLKPRPPPQEPIAVVPCEQRLSNMIGFVTFLEN